MVHTITLSPQNHGCVGNYPKFSNLKLILVPEPIFHLHDCVRKHMHHFLGIAATFQALSLLKFAGVDPLQNINLLNHLYVILRLFFEIFMSQQNIFQKRSHGYITLIQKNNLYIYNYHRHENLQYLQVPLYLFEALGYSTAFLPMFCAFGFSNSVSDRLSRIFKTQLGSRKICIPRHMSGIWWFPKGIYFFQAIFRFHVKLQGCTNHQFLGSMLLFSVVEKKQQFVHHLPASGMLPSMAACFLHRTWYHPFPQGVGKPPTARNPPKTKPMNAISSFWKVNARRYLFNAPVLNIDEHSPWRSSKC